MPRTARRAAARPDHPADQPGPGLYAELPVDALAVHPSNPRTDLGPDAGIAELADSIASRGVLEPLVVVPAGEAGGATHLVLMGQRRLTAARRAGLGVVPCIVRADLVDRTDALVDMLVENLHRSELSPVEEADAYRQLELEGLDVVEIARRTGRARPTVESRLQLLTLPDDARGRVHTREITLDQAAQLARFVDHPDLYRTLERAAGTHDWPYELQRQQSALDRLAAAALARADLEATGVRIVERKDLPGHEYDYRLTVALGGRYWERPTDEQLAAHRDCQGHAALMQGSQPIWLCLVPERHGSSTAPAAITPADEGLDGDAVEARNAERAAREAREAEQLELDRVAREQHRDSVAAATSVRQAWVRELATARGRLTAAPAQAIARHLVHAHTRNIVEPDSLQWLQFLGVDLDDVDDVTDFEAVEQALAQRVNRRCPHRVLLAMLAAHNENFLQSDSAWPFEGGVRSSLLPWLDLLVELGWTPSSWEAERIAAARQPSGPGTPAGATDA